MVVTAFSMIVVVAAQLTHGARSEENHNALEQFLYKNRVDI